MSKALKIEIISYKFYQFETTKRNDQTQPKDIDKFKLKFDKNNSNNSTLWHLLRKIVVFIKINTQQKFLESMQHSQYTILSVHVC